MKIATISLAFISLLYACSSGNTSNPADLLTPQQLEQALEKKECNAFRQHLKGSMDVKPVYKNALSMKVKAAKFIVSLKNTASVVTYKDVVVKWELLAKTGSVVKEGREVLREFYPPNKVVQKTFQFNISNSDYKDITSFNWRIESCGCK